MTELPLVDVFSKPFEVWETREPSLDEVFAGGTLKPVKVKILGNIGSASEAANYIVRVRDDTGLSNHIRSALNESSDYKAWQKDMPSCTPKELSKYQQNYKQSDLALVSEEIAKEGKLLSSGQFLFHGGLWPNGKSFVLTRPLSTSLCPQVALRNAEYKAKAYDAGRIDLWVLQVQRPNVRAFVYKNKGTNLGHEKEVLIGAGSRLTLTRETLVRNDYKVAKYNATDKMVNVYIMQVEVS